jgi:hypothetical protein
MAINIGLSKPALSAGYAVALGEYKDTTSIAKFGYNGQVGTSWETVWDGNNVYTYIDTASTATVTSSNSLADNGGTVKIYGVDANYDLVDETLTIGGAAGVVEFYRVFRVELVTATTGIANVGTITVTVDSKSAALIQPTNGQTLMCIYTVPRNVSAYLIQLDVGSSKDAENEIRVMIKQNGQVQNTKDFISIRGGFVTKPYSVPLYIPAESDIEIQAQSGATSAISAGFELILVENKT